MNIPTLNVMNYKKLIFPPYKRLIIIGFIIHKMSKKTTDKTVEETYKMMELHDQILALPDTYIGSIEADNLDMWINDNTGTMVHKKISYVPGLCKIYDEILVNAHDHSMRPGTCCKTIKVTIDQDTGEISVWNDGQGIPIQIHKEHKIYIPEMIFGRLLTSSNYGQTGKMWGGKNGFGAKLANIFSKHFSVETLDSDAKKKYVQHFHKNMYKIDKAEISDVSKSEKPYTKITFTPDYAKFGLDGLTDDIAGLFRKRVYDIAACDCKKVKVYLNNELINITSFGDYIKLFYPDEDTKMTYREVNEFWKIGVVYTPNAGFTHMSHVNGIWTYSQNGGTHVAHVNEQLIKGLLAFIKDKYKGVDVRPSYLKDNMALFIDCTTEDPSFSSQTKECLTTKTMKFTKKCDIDDNFILAITKLGIIEDAVEFAKLKGSAELKKTDGKKVKRIFDQKKLVDAKWAGTRRSKECRLIITEGDSAASFAMEGLDIIGREKYGIFPIRGKMLNVRDAPAQQILKNAEIANIKRILGLKQNVVYNKSNIDKLRYGGIFLLTDSDTDGYHIKGLVINFIEYFWPELAQIKGFFQTMNTPIIKAYKKSDTKIKHPLKFYTLTEYNKWKNSIGASINKWTVDYYKGLGSSNDEEARSEFVDFEKKLLSFAWEPGTKQQTPDKTPNNDPDEKSDDESDSSDDSDKSSDSESDNEKEAMTSNNSENDTADSTSKSHAAIMLAFSKNLANKRKEWLQGYDKNIVLEPKDQTIPYSEFINKEMIHFSNDDVIRSVPSICDGLKPSQRKILFTILELGADRRSKRLKVSDFGSLVSARTSYIHGPTSLFGAIIKMGQNFTGSNNINLLFPDGNFGHRKQGGKDAANERYTHTYMECLTRLIFRKEDDAIYNYLTEENKVVEPDVFAPIIPMVLVNGAEGIGTGYSSAIPCYNPKDIIANIIRMLNDEDVVRMKPWYKGFRGGMIKKDDYTYVSHGVIDVPDESTVKISELPIEVWSDNYEEFLKTIMVDSKESKVSLIDIYDNSSGNNTVDFTLTFSGHNLQKLIKSKTIMQKLKLTSSLSTANMYLHDANGKIVKYDTVEDILHDFYDYRLHIYDVRKAYYTRILKNELRILTYKIKFIRKVCEREIIVEKKKKSAIIERLVELGFPKLSHDLNAIDTDSDEQEQEKDNELVDESEVANKKTYKTYDYVTNLPLFSLTEEKIEELEKQHADKKAELELYENTSVQDLWRMELDELSNAYDKWLENELETMADVNGGKKKTKVAKKAKTQKIKEKK